MNDQEEKENSAEASSVIEDFSEIEESEDGIETLCNEAKDKLIPSKSKKLYNKAYDDYKNWLSTKKDKTINDKSVLAYVTYLSKNNAPSTCWTTYSKLKRMILLYDKVDISKFSEVIQFLKVNKIGFKPKKSETLTRENLNKFLLEAPDKTYLATKVLIKFILIILTEQISNNVLFKSQVIAIFGIYGALRCDEIVKIVVADVQK